MFGHHRHGPFADPGYQRDHRPRYRIDDPDHVRNAWARLHQGDNAARYDAYELRQIIYRIRAAATHFGITLVEHGKLGPAGMAGAHRRRHALIPHHHAHGGR